MEKIEFEGSQGALLAARLDKPVGRIRACALFAHCFGCNKDFAAASSIAKALVEEGIAVLRFDFTGLGKSDGEFANTNFTSNVQDLVKAADFMRDNLDAPAILVGHSLGGAAVLAAASYVPEAKAVVTIGAPVDAGHVAHLFSDKTAEIEEKGEAEISLGGHPFKIRKQFLDDLKGRKLEDCIAGLDKALLVMHAPLDDIVSIDNAARIFMAAKHPKSFVTLDDADHLVRIKEHGYYAARVISAWVSRYLPPEEHGEEEDAPDEGVIVRSTGKGKYQQFVRAGKHSFLADEPESFVGDDTGPTPYDLLNASLGACKAMTIRVYAEHRGLQLEGVEVRVSHDKVKGESGKVDQFTCDIKVIGDALTPEERARLIEIADKCSVHKTLYSEVVVKTQKSKG